MLTCKRFRNERVRHGSSLNKILIGNQRLCRAVVHCLGACRADNNEVPVRPPSHPNPHAESDMGVVSASKVENVSPARTSDSSSVSEYEAGDTEPSSSVATDVPWCARTKAQVKSQCPGRQLVIKVLRTVFPKHLSIKLLHKYAQGMVSQVFAMCVRVCHSLPRDTQRCTHSPSLLIAPKPDYLHFFFILAAILL